MVLSAFNQSLKLLYSFLSILRLTTVWLRRPFLCGTVLRHWISSFSYDVESYPGAVQSRLRITMGFRKHIFVVTFLNIIEIISIAIFILLAVFMHNRRWVYFP